MARPRGDVAILRATESEGLAGEALRFMVLTASRVTEATELIRSELDLGKRTWILPAARHKAVRDRVMPLSPQALALLARCPRIEGEERVFGGFDITPVINRVRERMGGEAWEPRDLRRTAATLLAGVGVDESIIARILGHARSDKSSRGSRAFTFGGITASGSARRSIAWALGSRIRSRERPSRATS